MKRLGLGLAAVALVAFVGLRVFGQADAKPKYKIEEIMEKAHDKEEGILKKIVEGKASDAEKKQLLELYTELSKNKPPKGDPKSWKEKTTAMVVAAKDVAEGKDGAVKKLTSTVKCKACHDLHQPD